MTDVTVIVPARNAASSLGRALAALAAQRTDLDYEVIVVDNASDDGTGEIAVAAGVRLVRQDRMTGAGEARNTGAAQATAPLLAFTDADCVPTPDWLDRGARALAAYELIQGAVRPDPAFSPQPFDRSVWVEREALYETASLFVRRSLFERLGGFEDWLGDAAGRPIAEDVWLGWRARRAGARTAFRADALVHHAVERRGPAAHVRERLRLAHFPAIARRIPELRREFFFARCFLSRRTAAFDAAATGLALAATTRSPLPLMAALPYAREVVSRSLPWGRRAPIVAGAEIAADAVGAAALIAGSARERTLLL